MAAERSGLICPKGLLDERLDQLLRQFWEVETCTDPIVKASKEELDCESHFVKNFALRRFQSLERKLSHHPELRTQYSAFIKEYLNLGHMSLVPPELHQDCKHFLPHHCVLKKDSTMTKLSVVFDGSAVTTSDQLLLSFSSLQSTSKTSRRSVLSSIARLYDPLGLVGPVVTKAKIFLQKLCREHLSWDESLPQGFYTEWQDICRSFSHAQRAEFPRLALTSGALLEIHGFCDASIEAYGACVYIVFRSPGAESRLLCAKSRVSPLKTLTVPKLELAGAELLSRMMAEVHSLGAYRGKYFCWCDSSTVLSWIREEPNIQNLTNSMEWRYVPTLENPADILSRGALPTELIGSRLWCQGPPYLLKTQEHWPVTVVVEKPALEPRPSVLLLFSECLLTSISLADGVRHKGITVHDLKAGTRMLLWAVQRANLGDEMRTLQTKGMVASSSSLASLSPFLDQFGLFRVDGRLKNSSLDYDGRHPVILPRSHPVTRSLILSFHERNLHAVPRSLLAMIRSQYWPIGGRKTVLKATNKCVRCFRMKPRLLEHVMGDLPKESVEGYQVFDVTGIDFCGPFFYKSEVRNKAPIKCYISVFICFTTKAVHLELIWSDNATNFVGAKNQLSELKRLFLSDEHQRSVLDFCLPESIEWKFIPPRSPHFGGLWEAAVKTAMYHFYRVVGSAVLKADDLQTLLYNIGAVINSSRQ
ncbi:uncharacterized protein LOC123257248 [Drosophila ananassae]|uniref:uncharacterized protein LOC123257248 n=1 Tax=Drosophila ananassae TaxID=7217 RepID=UPI001CFF5B7B|nr:uncharacterized protein LOC123257248 [Drosophila ananassae]